MKIRDDILAVLAGGTCTGEVFFIPGDLERKLYLDVDRVLKAAGGKWNRTAGGHVFAGESAADAMEGVILTGAVTSRKQAFGEFFTPAPVASHAADLCRIMRGMDLLEPSAGHGALALAAAERGAVVDCIDIQDRNTDLLAKLRPRLNMVWTADFLQETPYRNFQRVLMNPPFANRADVLHFNHAVKFIEPGGRIVAIMSASVTFRNDQLTIEFRRTVEEAGGVIIRLPDGSFRSSGTDVDTVMVAMDVR